MSASQLNSQTRRTVALSSIAAVVMIGQQVASKVVRDGFFLSQYDITALPVATLAAAVVSFAAALILSRFISAFTPSAAVPVLFAANGVLFLLEAAVADHLPKVVAAVLFLHVAAFGGAVVSGFWSVINERFDPYTARLVMGRIAGGATLGGVLGGVATWLFSDVPPSVLLGAFGLSSIACAVVVGLIAGGLGKAETKPPNEEPKPTSIWAGFNVLAENRYPRAIAVVVFMGALMTGAVDYVFKSGVSADTASAGLVGFFAVFYTGTGVVTFIVQAVGTSRVLRWLGVVPTVALFPAVTLVMLLAALVLPALATLILLRGAAMIVENSFYRSGYELLYTAVPREQKRPVKLLIDLGCDRIGGAAASGLALVAIAWAAGAADNMLLLVALAASVTIGVLLVGVRRQYVASLGQQLRTALEPGTDQGNDTARALASTFVADFVMLDDSIAADTHRSGVPTTALSAQALRAEIEARVQAKRGQPGVVGVPRPRSIVAPALLATPLRDRLRTIESGRLGWAELQQSAPGTIGQLGDILLSRRESLETRMRAAELLAIVPSRRSVDALTEVLRSPQPRLRRAGAIALLKVCTASPSLRPRRRDVTELADQELRRPARALGERTDFEQSSPFQRDARGNELASSLEMVFLILALRGETGALRLALTAITSIDATQRGTGLEYLDNLLPGDLRGRLLARAEQPELTQADSRVPSEIVRDLAEQFRGGNINLSELRSRFWRARREHYDLS